MSEKKQKPLWHTTDKQSSEKEPEGLSLTNKLSHLNLDEEPDEKKQEVKADPPNQSSNLISEITDQIQQLNLSTENKKSPSAINDKTELEKIEESKIESEYQSKDRSSFVSNDELNTATDSEPKSNELSEKQHETETILNSQDKWIFRSKADENFILNIAPSIMKKMIIAQRGWKIYNGSNLNVFIDKNHSLQLIDPDLVNKRYKDLMSDKIFSISFTSEYDRSWLKRCLARPISNWDCFGYVYVYYVKGNQDKKIDDKVMPFKIGRSVNCPKRISHSEKENKETYSVAITEPSQYYKHFEAIIHDYFKDERIIRTEIKDGKTEWFYKKFSDIEQIIKKCKIYLKVVHKDKAELQQAKHK